jgi:hypothetical protein
MKELEHKVLLAKHRSELANKEIVLNSVSVLRGWGHGAVLFGITGV